MDAYLRAKTEGFSIVEVLLSLALIAIMAGAVLAALQYADGLRGVVIEQVQERDAIYECMLVIRAMRDGEKLGELPLETQSIVFEEGSWRFGAPDEGATHVTFTHMDDDTVEVRCDVGNGQPLITRIAL